MTAVLFAMVLSNFNIYATNALLARHYVQYKIGMQVQDLLPALGCSIATGGIVYLATSFIPLHWTILSILFAVCYIAICYIFRIGAIDELRYNIKSFLRKF